MVEVKSHDAALRALRATLDNEDAQIEALLATVGARVRAARSHAGFSRRVLSEMSGVSQRYLAQLEGGQGNISIALLMRIANALDLQLETLIGEAAPWSSGADDDEIHTLTRLLRGATRKQRDQVRNILDPERPEDLRAQRIALIGLRGAGKSTLGRRAATQLGVPFVELNHEIEKSGGMPVHEIMALYGAEGYRHLESRAVRRIAASREAVVVAVAGGVVTKPDAFDYLLRFFHTIWLHATPEDHMLRVRGQGDERPMAGKPDAMVELRDILKSREALYRRAGASVDTSGRTVEQSLADVIGTIRRNNFSPQGDGPPY
ncbi:MAG: helix-turn-helix transcriptional regulator [Pseudomonadota bacterium]